jgi:hypothetical protein
MRLVVVEDLKVLNLQAVHRPALLVADYNRNQYLIDVQFDYGSSGLRPACLLGERMHPRYQSQATEDKSRTHPYAHFHLQSPYFEIREECYLGSEGASAGLSTCVTGVSVRIWVVAAKR